MLLLLITALITATMICNGALIHQTIQETCWTLHMNRVLREIMTGPLQGKKVVLMVDDSLVKDLEGGTLVGAAATQTLILSFPRHRDDNLALYRSLKPRKTVCADVRLQGIVTYIHITL